MEATPPAARSIQRGRRHSAPPRGHGAKQAPTIVQWLKDQLERLVAVWQRTGRGKAQQSEEQRCERALAEREGDARDEDEEREHLLGEQSLAEERASLAQDISTRAAGARGTRASDSSAVAVWQRGMDALGVPEADRWEYSGAVLRDFAAWQVQQGRWAALKPFTTMLNKQWLRRFPLGGSPWNCAEARGIKVGFLDVRQRHKATEAQAQRAAGIVPTVKPKRRAAPDPVLESWLARAEQAVQGGRQEEAGFFAVLFLATLFGVRADTLGAAVPGDVLVGPQGLAFTIRAMKGWSGGRQRSTGRSLPFFRHGVDSVPWGDSAQHPRTRMIRIIEAAVASGAFWWLNGPGPQVRPKHMAANSITTAMCEYGVADLGPDDVLSSHSMRITMVSACRGLGYSKVRVTEWGMWAMEKTMESYRERDYATGVFVAAVFDFMGQRHE